jgi:uncharacterized protein
MPTFVGGVFMVVGLLLSSFFARLSVPEMLALHTYQRTDAFIQQVSLHEGGKGSFSLDVTYTYQWDGKSFQGDRVSPFQLQSKSEARRWLNILTERKERQEPQPVWLNPASPHQSMLDKTVGAGFIALPLTITLIFCTIGVSMVLADGRPAAPPSPPPPTHDAPASDALSNSTPPASHPKARQILLSAMAITTLMFAFWIRGAWPHDIQGILRSEGSVLRYLPLLFPLVGILGLAETLRQLWRLYQRLPASPSEPSSLRGVHAPVEHTQTTPQHPPQTIQQPQATPPGQVTRSASSKRLVPLLGLLALACLAHTQQETLLTWAAARGWIADPAQVVQTQPDLPPLTAADQSLIDAANRGDVAAVDQALGAGANVNAFDSTGESALMQAAAEGHLDVVRQLLQRGADPQFTNSIHPHRKGDTALLRAAYRGHQEVFLALLQAGAHTDVRNQWGWTAVHMAAGGDCVPCLEALLERQLPLDETADANRGETPFLMAAGQDAPHAMAWLQAHHVNVRAKDAHGEDAMGWARFFKAKASQDWLTQHLPEPANSDH